MKKIKRRALSIDEINSLALNGIDMSKFTAIHRKIKKIATNKSN